MMDNKDTSVQVTIRIRPQNAKEQVDLCRVCTFVTAGEPQVILGKDKAYTYDYVYDVRSEQQDIYHGCIEQLVEGCFHGYNATVLAYGQTGSGKTYTMGTGFDVTSLPDEQGMVPRAVHHLFTGITSRIEQAQSNNTPIPQFTVTAQFLELYNEEIIDLFDTARENSRKLKIHETLDGHIYVNDATTQHVHTELETMQALKRGAVSRTVGSTNMNAQSSRSHAIFTIIIKQETPIINVNSEGITDNETLTAKFHFVDLAGSERLKRTGATGDRAKEGISINCGLLALGNVISALGDQTKKGSHVPYRDSKLTRLLQDSLGGNSRTLMIACISPSDRDFMETLNTLKYANRARNIKNKVSVNQDKASAQLALMRKQIIDLENQLTEFRSGRLVVSSSGSVVANDLSSENTMLKTDNDKLRIKVKSMQELIDFQNEKIATLQAERDFHALQHQDESTGQVINGNDDNHVQNQLKQYTQQIQELKTQLSLSESSNQYGKRPLTNGSHRTAVMAASITSRYNNVPVAMETDQLLKIAKNNIENEKSLFRKPRPRRRKRPDYCSSYERMSTDVEEWVMKCATSESDVMITEGEDGSDTEINENECEDDHPVDSDSDNDDYISISSDSDSSVTNDEEFDKNSVATSIAELSTEINIKQQLFDQLEKAQRSLNALRSQYEEKMILLQNQIKATEAERDQCIKQITNRQTEHEEALVKEMNDKFEKQLKLMKTELKQLQTAKREHAKALQKNAQQGIELQKLNIDLLEMKKQKFKLMRKLKEETLSMKKKEQKREKELVQLKRDYKRKESMIKTLQADAKRKEIIIKKRSEEVTALKRHYGSQTNLSTENRTRKLKTTSSTNSLSNNDEPAAKKAKLHKRYSSVFSSDTAKRKLKAMSTKIKEIVSRSQTMNEFENEMDEWMIKREELSHKADQLKQQRDDLLQATEDQELLITLEDELDALVAQISWANDCIEKLQEDIVAYEDMRTDTNTIIDITALIHTCSTKEAKYILENFVNTVIETSISCYQKEASVKSLRLRLATSEQHAELIKIYSSPLVPQSPLVINSRTVSKISSILQPISLSPAINKCSDTNITITNSSETSTDFSPPIITNDSKSITKIPPLDETFTKVRRRTGLPNELANHRRQSSDPLRQTSNDVLKENTNNDDDNIKTRKTSSTDHTSLYSPKRSQIYKKKSSSPQTMESLDIPSPECPGSPLSGRLTRSGESNTTLKGHDTNTEMNKGQIEVERPYSTRSTKPLLCSHIAKGHNSGILSLCSTDSLLFSASQDCTVKIWDLVTGNETAVLTRHHSYVRKVIYDSDSQLVFTACQSLIKLWDIRDLRNPQFVKTLLPPGQTVAHLSSADTVVQDLLVFNDLLFSASGNIINVWDLRQMNAIGRLVGHAGTIGTMTTVPGSTYIVTGSRDRLIKVFDTSDLSNSEIGFNQISQSTLSPAHYDTVSSLIATDNNIMFSACGVSIKQWDINKRCLLQAIDGAHLQTKSNMITSLTHLPPSLLVSGCKSGILKLWSTNECQPFGEVVAHKSPITCLTANNTTLFSGSSDRTIKMWKMNPSHLTNL